MFATRLDDSPDHAAIEGPADFNDVAVFHPSAVDKEAMGCEGNRHIRHFCLRDADSGFDYRLRLVVALSAETKPSTTRTRRFTKGDSGRVPS
jgi:hypothetical protein